MDHTDHVNLSSYFDRKGVLHGVLLVSSAEVSLHTEAAFGPFDGVREVLAAALLAVKCLLETQDYTQAGLIFGSYAADGQEPWTRTTANPSAS